jgi:hypothetical protein
MVIKSVVKYCIIDSSLISKNVLIICYYLLQSL